MENSQTAASATVHGQEVKINDQCCVKLVLGFPSLGTFRTQGGCGGGATQLHSFQPGGFSSLVHSLHGSQAFAGGHFLKTFAGGR